MDTLKRQIVKLISFGIIAALMYLRTMLRSLFQKSRIRAWSLVLITIPIIFVYTFGEFPSELVIIDRDVHRSNLLEDFFEITPPPLEKMENTEVLLLNTSFCQIPEFPVWSRDALKWLEKKCTGYYRGNPRCAEKHVHAWSYIDSDSYLYINLTAVRKSGYSWNSIKCCYRVIIRVEQTYQNYDSNADNVIRYSDECYPVNQTKQYIDAEFIRFICISTTQPTFNDVVSREFYAFPKLDSKGLNKTKKWQASESPSPPNVVILGVDTMSRLGSQRVLPQSIGLLKRLGAVELKGYMKVGQTTLPNVMAFLCGYSLEQLRTRYLCDWHLDRHMNDCPLIWNPFGQVGYLTATLEDVPFLVPFNNKRIGFVEKPTDFYFRPFMLAVMKHLPRREYFYLRCLGQHQIEQVLLNYIESALKLGSAHKTPLFVHTWFTSPAHECSLSAKYTDASFASFIRKIESQFNNTILVYMSDHGEPFGGFRETLQGRYEDNLPFIWIYLPKRLRQQHPDWHRSLEINAERVTSHYDLYKTLVHILQTFDRDNVAAETYHVLASQKGQSLLEPLPESRDCGAASIPEGYCACIAPLQIPVTNDVVTASVKVALNHLRNLLPNSCETPVLVEITTAKYFVTPVGTGVYIITFVTDPGAFLFEATIKTQSNSVKDLQLANDILRVNKMDRVANCVPDPLWEKYCYCK